MKILIAGNGFMGRKSAEKLREKHLVKTVDRGGEATFQQDMTEEFDVPLYTIGLPGGVFREEIQESPRRGHP